MTSPVPAPPCVCVWLEGNPVDERDSEHQLCARERHGPHRLRTLTGGSTCIFFSSDACRFSLTPSRFNQVAQLFRAPPFQPLLKSDETNPAWIVAVEEASDAPLPPQSLFAAHWTGSARCTRASPAPLLSPPASVKWLRGALKLDWKPLKRTFTSAKPAALAPFSRKRKRAFTEAPNLARLLWFRLSYFVESVLECFGQQKLFFIFYFTVGNKKANSWRPFFD